MHKLTTALH